MRTPMAGGVRIGANFNTNAYMHEETTIGFGVRISGRKYLSYCGTPFSDVSPWVSLRDLPKVECPMVCVWFITYIHAVLTCNTFCS